MTRTSAVLIESLLHCAPEVAGLFFAKEMIPLGLQQKVFKDSDAIRDVVSCLIGRVRNHPQEFVLIVEILEQVPVLASAVNTLKKCYSKYN